MLADKDLPVHSGGRSQGRQGLSGLLKYRSYTQNQVDAMSEAGGRRRRARTPRRLAEWRLKKPATATPKTSTSEPAELRLAAATHAGRENDGLLPSCRKRRSSSWRSGRRGAAICPPPPHFDRRSTRSDFAQGGQRDRHQPHPRAHKCSWRRGRHLIPGGRSGRRARGHHSVHRHGHSRSTTALMRP